MPEKTGKDTSLGKGMRIGLIEDNAYILNHLLECVQQSGLERGRSVGRERRKDEHDKSDLSGCGKHRICSPINY